jgi:hypothetical protein
MVEETLVSVEQLADLPNLEGPCISLYLSAYSPRNDSVPFGAHVHSALEKAKYELNSKRPPSHCIVAVEERPLVHNDAVDWPSCLGNSCVIVVA